MAAGGGPREPKATQVQPKWPQQEAEPEQPSVYSLMYAAVDSLQPKQHANRRGLGGRAAKQEPGHHVQSVPWAWKPMGSVLRGHSRHLVCLLRPQHRVLPGGGAHRSLTRSSRVAPSSRAAQAPQGKQAGGPGACPRGQGGVCKPSWRPLGATHMLVLIRDWLLAGVSSPWLPSLGGDCSGQEGAQPGAAQVLPAP